MSSGYGVPRIPRCPGTPYPEDTGRRYLSWLGKPRYPENTRGVLGIPYPQDTDGILRIPRCPEDTAGVLRCFIRSILIRDKIRYLINFEEVAILHVFPYKWPQMGTCRPRSGIFWRFEMCQKRFLRGTPATFSAQSSCTLLFLCQ